MMFAEDHPCRYGLLLETEPGELASQEILEKQLLAQPHRDRHAEALEAARRESEIALEKALELEERLVVEGDQVHVRETDAGFAQAVRKRLRRELRVVFPAREALLLRCRDDPAVLHQRGGAVVVERGDPQDAQRAGQKSV
jgi:hypothetical protein